ncbi:hypothetical protein B6A27_17345 [Anoxybacillus sp. UARK-01]|nr:hypothetical protein B6A27_17345 [Anoxybacillus sp. UARK-01]
MKKGNVTYFYHYNAHGDVIALTDAQGNVVARYEYDTWGQLLSQSGEMADENPYRYAGYQYDQETGLYYLIARYYHPTHGVFLSMDPDPGDSDDILTQNGYTYANNNPVMLVDPDGHFVWMAINAGFAAYDGYKAFKKGGWKAAAIAVGVGLVGGAAFKGAKIAYRVYKVRRAGRLDLQFFASGRRGKQARLRELANDDKLSSVLRGEIRRDINEIKRGKRRTIRVPKGYELAHRRGYEARKGYGYEHSDLQTIRNHRTQHKYDRYGRRR